MSFFSFFLFSFFFFFFVVDMSTQEGGGIQTSRVMLQVSLASILCPSKSDVALKITIGLVIDHY